MEWNEVSPLAFAFLGDAVYSMYVRSYVVSRKNAKPNLLQREAVSYERAGAQAKAAEKLLPSLSEEEAEMYRRGRNANPKTMAKHATMADYRKATGLEALIGYLHFRGREERIRELMAMILEDEGHE